MDKRGALADLDLEAWAQLPIPYLKGSERTLEVAGITVDTSWNDPMDPRDFTLVLATTVAGRPLALVWDEESGWRYGPFISGEQGVRTELAWSRYIGIEVLLAPATLAQAMARVIAGELVGSAKAPQFRSHTRFGAHGDAFDHQLAQLGANLGFPVGA